MKNPVSRSVLRLAGLLASAALAACAQPQGERTSSASECRLVSEATLPIQRSQGRFVVTAEVNRQPLRMLLDTGASRGGLTPPMVQALGLSQEWTKTIRFDSIGNLHDSQHPFLVHSVKLGPLEWFDRDVLSMNIVRADQVGDPESAVGLIGADILATHDVEFDFPSGEMTLYSVSHCGGDFIPWTGRHQTLRTELSAQGGLIIPIDLAGHPVRALIDTGSNVSSISRKSALAADVDARALEHDPSTTFTGPKGAPVPAHRHRFATLTIAGSTYKDVPIFVQEADFGSFDMLLGMDFLHSRKVWISYATGQVFMRYEGRPRSP